MLHVELNVINRMLHQYVCVSCLLKSCCLEARSLSSSCDYFKLKLRPMTQDNLSFGKRYDTPRLVLTNSLQSDQPTATARNNRSQQHILVLPHYDSRTRAMASRLRLTPPRLPRFTRRRRRRRRIRQQPQLLPRTHRLRRPSTDTNPSNDRCTRHS